MSSLKARAATAFRLGGVNLGRVLVYRLGVRLGLHPVRRVEAVEASGPYFNGPEAAPAGENSGPGVLAFGRWSVPTPGGKPDWFADPVEGKRLDHKGRNWWEIPDFDRDAGDIKRIWELSRMDWAPLFARRARAGDRSFLARLEAWVADWSTLNPGYMGPNWKCGQEASLRVLNLATASIILDADDAPTKGLLDLVEGHLRRIAPTLQYAVAQDNNHATSEAAALFVGGSWLADHGRSAGAAWEKSGRRWLEERVRRLIADDGGFSQYSVNYHRLMLDTLSLAELWRARRRRPAFSKRFMTRAVAATEWLRSIVDPESGDVPNMGANDGARILQITETDYRDYRPTVQIAAALFSNRRAYENASAISALDVLGIPQAGTASQPPRTRPGDDTGFAVLRRGQAMAVLRYPRFKFRPNQADALHVDFWRRGRNLLRDAGSFSYADDDAHATFSSVASHNTIQFDGRDQMPRLSRFLYAGWLKTSNRLPLVESDDETSFGAAYTDGSGATHRRKVSLFDDRLVVEDVISGFSDTAILRWRLGPGAWSLTADGVEGEGVRLVVETNAPMPRLRIVEGQESRYYLERTPLPVLEIDVSSATAITTTVRWDEHPAGSHAA